MSNLNYLSTRAQEELISCESRNALLYLVALLGVHKFQFKGVNILDLGSSEFHRFRAIQILRNICYLELEKELVCEAVTLICYSIWQEM